MGAIGARTKGAPVTADAYQEKLAKERWCRERFGEPYKAYTARIRRYL